VSARLLRTGEGVIDHDQVIASRSNDLATPPPFALSEVDIRRKHDSVVTFILGRGVVRRATRVVLLLALDFVGVMGAIYTALLLKTMLHGNINPGRAWNGTDSSIAIAYLITALNFARVDAYADRPRRPGLAKITIALAQATVVGLIFELASGTHFNSYYLFYGSFFFATVYIGTLRELYTNVTGWLLERAGYRRRAVLVGSGAHIAQVAHALGGYPRSDREVLGYISLTPQRLDGIRSLGSIDGLGEVIGAHGVDEVIIADPDFPEDRTLDLVDRCHQRGVTVHVAPSTMEILVQRAEFMPGASVPLFTLRPPVLEGVQFIGKRAFDLVGSILLLVVLSPMLLAIALAIKLTSRGPVIYRSVRPGIGRRPFQCLKFRTMSVGADAAQDELEELNESDGTLFKIRDDPRLTAVGRILRRFSLDELPQIINVLRGEMSLVGPRPLPTRDFDKLEEWHKKRYLVLPGITGLWQVSGRSELNSDDLVRLDFLYLERWSILLDMSILLKTIPAVISRRGAY
jgi:exopolysaccharide biosynthesis polyprenyl glycosylphosphotransferase